MPANYDGDKNRGIFSLIRDVLIHDGDDESEVFLLSMAILALFGCLPILLYSLRFWVSGQFLRILGVGTLVAGAALLTGFLMGFIFAIPRRGGQKGRVTTTQPEDTKAEGPATADSVQPNENLVEISDWLTKIIVGVGLVELRSIPGELGKLSYYLAQALEPAPCAGGASCVEPLVSGQAVGLAIMIFYFALGFLLGCVWTMIYFDRDLRGRLKKEERHKEDERRLKETANRIMSAEASIAENQLDKAMASIDKALKNDPQNGFAVMTKARILKRQALQSGQPDRDSLLKQALAYADQAIVRLPNLGEPIYNKACYQALLGFKKEAIEGLKSAFCLDASLRKTAKGDDDLASLEQDADFVKLIGQAQPPDA